MQFYTDEECRAWMRDRELGEGDWPEFGQAELPTAQRKLSFDYAAASFLCSLFSGDSEILLWVTATRIWSANLHLYYRFRESYGDRRLVEDAPGHLFLDYERADLLSFFQIAIQSGWDFWALGAEGNAKLFVSHDEYYLASASLLSGHESN